MAFSLSLIKFFFSICIMQSFLVASSLFNIAAAADAVGFGAPSTVGDEPCNFEDGPACCNGKGQEVIETLKYCLQLADAGECSSKDACFATRLNPNFVGYCCRNPKGPHNFPRGHPKLGAPTPDTSSVKSDDSVAETSSKANVAAESKSDAESKSADFGGVSTVGDEPCNFEDDPACCNGKGQKVIG